MVLNLGPLDWESSALTTRLAVTLSVTLSKCQLCLIKTLRKVGNFGGANIVFYVSLSLKKHKWRKSGVQHKYSLNPCHPNSEKGEKLT